MAPELLQVRAAALKLGVHENTLRGWEKAGLIPAVGLPSGVRRFRVEDIDRLSQEMYGAVGSQFRGAKPEDRPVNSRVRAAKDRVQT